MDRVGELEDASCQISMRAFLVDDFRAIPLDCVGGSPSVVFSGWNFAREPLAPDPAKALKEDCFEGRAKHSYSGNTVGGVLKYASSPESVGNAWRPKPASSSTTFSRRTLRQFDLLAIARSVGRSRHTAV